MPWLDALRRPAPPGPDAGVRGPWERVIFPNHALVFTELSEALLLVGRVDEAHTLARRLLELSRTLIGRGYQAHAYRLLGETTRML